MKYIKYLLIILILSFINVNADTVYKKGTIAKNTTDVYVRSCASGTCDRILNDTGGKISISYPETFEIIGEEGNFYKIKLLYSGFLYEGYISKVNILQVRLEYQNLKKQLETFIECAEYGLSEFQYATVIDKKGKEKRQKIKLQKPIFQIQYVKELPPGLADIKQKLFFRAGVMTQIEEPGTQEELDKIVKKFKLVNRADALFVKYQIDYSNR